MVIFLNSKEFNTKSKTLKGLIDEIKISPDICIINGYATKNLNECINELDHIFLLKKNEIPKNLSEIYIARNHPSINELIKNHRIGIAGVGGVGSNVAISLARVGFDLCIVDFDTIDITNLNRQQYYIEDIGKFKVDALKDRLLKINPNLDIQTHKIFLDKSNINEIFINCSLVCECFDNDSSKLEMINNFLSKPLISTSGMAGWGRSLDFKIVQFSKNVTIVGDLNSSAKDCSLMAPRVGICANIVANLALEKLKELY